MSETPDPLTARLQGLVIEEARTLRGFLDVLAREQQALVAGDADAMLALAREKSEAAGHLARLDMQRGETLAAAGLGSGRAAIDAWLARAPAQSGLRRQWDELLALAAEAQRINADNGSLIKTRLAHNQQTLAVLLAATDRAALYGPDGQARASTAGRHIDKA